MDEQKPDQTRGRIMTLLQWFTGLGLVGMAMVVCGALGVFLSRDGMIIGGSAIMGSVAIGIAILAAAKN